MRIARTAAGRPPTNTQAATSSADEVDSRLGSSLWPMITPPRTGPTIWPSAETVVSVPNRLMRASELCAWAMMLCAADGARHVPDAERGRGDRERGNRLRDTRGRTPPMAAMARPSTSRTAGWCRSVHRPKPTASSIGGTAKHAAVRPRVVPSAPRARSRYVDTGRARVTATCSRKMLTTVPTSHSGGRERSLRRTTSSTVPLPRRSRARAGVGQNFQPRSGVATSTSTPSGSRNLKNRGGSACSAP